MNSEFFTSNAIALIGVAVGGVIAGLIIFAYFLTRMQANLHYAVNTSPEVAAMTRKRKIQLVDEWRSAWRWISVNCMVAAGALQGAWLFIPDDMKVTIPPGVLQWVTGALLVIGVIGRLTKQGEAPK